MLIYSLIGPLTHNFRKNALLNLKVVEMALFGKKSTPEFKKILGSAQEDNAQAQFECAVAYAEGKIVKKDEKEAAYWMMLAAENEHVEAMWHGAGELERNGTWEGDPEKAFGWYLKSAEKGYAEAMHDVAIAYKNGEIVEADPSKSFEWYLKAAENGIVGAMYSVAHRYEAGEVVPINFEKTLFWLKQCQLNGYEGEINLDEWIEEIEKDIKTNPSKEENINSDNTEQNDTASEGEFIGDAKMNNLVGTDAQYSDGDLLEDFTDALIDIGAMDLRNGEKKVLGTGVVEMECTHFKNTKNVVKQNLELLFQVLDPDKVKINWSWKVFPEGDDESGSFEEWISMTYEDPDGNNDPTANDNIGEFIYDLTPIEDDDDE